MVSAAPRKIALSYAAPEKGEKPLFIGMFTRISGGVSLGLNNRLIKFNRSPPQFLLKYIPFIPNIIFVHYRYICGAVALVLCTMITQFFGLFIDCDIDTYAVKSMYIPCTTSPKLQAVFL